MHSIESINVRFQGIVFHKVLVARCSGTICHQGDKFIGKCYFNVNRLSSYVSTRFFPNLYRVTMARLYFGGKSATTEIERLVGIAS